MSYFYERYDGPTGHGRFTTLGIDDYTGGQTYEQKVLTARRKRTQTKTLRRKLEMCWDRRKLKKPVLDHLKCRYHSPEWHPHYKTVMWTREVIVTGATALKRMDLV